LFERQPKVWKSCDPVQQMGNSAGDRDDVEQGDGRDFVLKPRITNAVESSTSAPAFTHWETGDAVVTRHV